MSQDESDDTAEARRALAERGSVSLEELKKSITERLTKETLAARLNGREYRNEITKDEEAQAKAAGLVVLFGASDDLAELRGAIDDEIGCYGGGEALIVNGALFEFDACDGPCKYAQAAEAEARKSGLSISILWSKDPNYSWIYATKAPHATFDVMEDGEKYCRGIVFELPR